MDAHDADVVVIGSGFGGSVAALRLVQKGYRVAVLEAGRRFGAADFARTNWNLRRYLFMPRLGLRGIQRLTFLDDLVVISGAGVGGGSLVYANTLYEPLQPFFDDRQWAEIADWRDELASYYDRARTMLGGVETPFESEAERVVREVARRMGVADSFRRTVVAVDFDRCVRCGGCMVGCRYEAKNTLDRNYLRLAEEGGATVHPEREATLIRRVAGGWEVDTRHPGAWLRTRPRLFRAEQVVLAAGVLGTLELLFRSGLGGPNVGMLVRSNSEAIVGAGARDASIDYSEGIAIGSSFHPSADTHIEPVRYPKGSSLMGLFSTVLVDGGGRTPRPLRWLGTALRHPARFARSHWLRRWAERTVVLLVMQARDNSVRVRWTGRRLRSAPGHGEPSPSWLPEANEAARVAADVMGGLPGSGLNEVLLGRPFTAHILGGAPIGATPADGVVDAWHRVFTEPGLHVVDGAAVTANLGANPSLTIAAQAERALAFWPKRGEPDPRPPLGSLYVRVEPV
ncbi:MAG TPA: GMC family oxidoreductase [Gaiellaceae bacterium]|nr:GMC family oxidoreductase [Gaiellaceae bacterium]